jgi:hypothetical protein
MAENLMAITSSATPSDDWQPEFDILEKLRTPLPRLVGLDMVTINIGGFGVRLVFHSKGLRESILPAFIHLISEENPALTLHLHDFGSAPAGEKWVMYLDPPQHVDAFSLIDKPNFTSFVQAQGKILSIIDWGRNEAYWIVRNPTDITYIERSSPLRPLLTHWLGRRGCYLAHGAAVGNSQGAVLILGHGGAGKSTSALVCLEAGLEYIADDHCLVEAEHEPAVNSLFSTGKLAEQQLQHFPVLSASAETEGRPDEEKVVLYLSRLASLPINRRLPLRAILLAHITGRRETTLQKVSPALAFRAIAPSCALHFPLARTDVLSCFGKLVKRIPSYRLELGTNYSSTPTAIRSLLASKATEL